MISIIKNLEEEYLQTPDSDPAKKVTLRLKIKKMAIESVDADILPYLYACIHDNKDKDIEYDCRAVLAKRKDSEKFLLQKIEHESDIHKVANIIHILGIKDSEHAATLARERITYADSAYLRKVCIYVLGWVGDLEDIPTLTETMISDNEIKNRIFSATAMRQIFWRKKELKNQLLTALKTGFNKNSTKEVLLWIAISTSDIAEVDFKVKESRDNPNIVKGSPDKAIELAKKFFDDFVPLLPTSDV